MGYYLSLPVLALAAVLQTTFVPQIRLFNGQLDLVFLLVILWSVNVSLEEGLTWAFIGGIAQDLLSNTPIGASTLGMIIIIFVIDALNRQIFSINILIVVGLITTGTILQHSILLVMLALKGLQYDLLDMIRYTILTTLLFNIIASLPTYGIIRFIQNRITHRRTLYNR